MRRSILLPLTLLPLLAGTARAADPAPTPPEKPKDEPTEFKLGGSYTIWGLQQRGFLLGNPENPLDNGNYVVQVLRLGARFEKKNYGVVTRLDAAQGWWGADNSPDVEVVTGVDADGNPTSTTIYNPYKLFRDKDTNYAIHVDHAYVWANIPKVSVMVQAGRWYLSVGHQLVFDHDVDGMMLEAKPSKTASGRLFWAKLSEGLGSVVAPTGLLITDTEEMRDADLFGLDLALGGETAKLGAFGLYYDDRSGLDAASYLPQGIGHLNRRFQPNISNAIVLGLTLDGKLEVGEELRYGAELDYLMGEDKVQNADTAGGLLDRNDGDLQGWNALVMADQRLDAGIPLELGLTLGAGSGDDDVTSGPGNFNKLLTMGSFFLTNVWEDSTMPDIGGIAPQGLGSPAHRGYRELENTVAAQGRILVEPHERIDIKLSYTFLRATRPVQGFDLMGVPTRQSARDLGQELDLDLGIQVWKGLSYTAQSGLFLPGEAAGLLLNGTTAFLDPAWEIRHVVTASF